MVKSVMTRQGTVEFTFGNGAGKGAGWESYSPNAIGASVRSMNPELVKVWVEVAEVGAGRLYQQIYGVTVDVRSWEPTSPGMKEVVEFGLRLFDLGGFGRPEGAEELMGFSVLGALGKMLALDASIDGPRLSNMISTREKRGG